VPKVTNRKDDQVTVDRGAGDQTTADQPPADHAAAEQAAIAAAGNEGPGSDPRGRHAERPRDLPKRGWKDVAVRTVREFKQDNASMVAAAAAFYAWLALLPAILAAIMLYGLLASPDQVTRHIEQLTENLSDDVASTLRQPVEQATGTGGNGLTIGLIIALAGAVWSASGGMNGLVQGITIAYDEDDNRNFVVKRLLAIGLTLGGIVGFLLAVALIAVVPPVVDAVGLDGFVGVTVEVGRWILLALLMIVGLAVLYRLAPDRDDARMRWVSPGAVVATVLWLAVSAGFSFYVSNFGSYNQTYGALAGVIILELWLYLTCMIIIFGAELNAKIDSLTAKDTTVGHPRRLGRRGAQKADEVGPAT
jgi:membrane protein